MRLIKGENDLLTVNPALAKEWNYELNGTLTPDQVTEKSNKKVWWKCDKGHEWETMVITRTKGHGCPICKQVLQGYNDLLTVNPTLAKEWNYEKNGTLTPDQVTEKSHKKVWWKCDKGHEWNACIANRARGNGCPICANKQVLQGYNDLLTLNPTLAKEWNYELNGTLTPDQVTEKSGKKVWWKCDKGHEWETMVVTRTRGHGCPICDNKQVLQGYNDLLTLNPTLAKEWNYELNGTLTPDQVTEKSDKKVWWKCDKGHEWETMVVTRTRGHGCPFCAGKRRK